MKTKPHLHTLALLCLGAAFITPSTSAQSTQMLKLHARNTLPQSGANLGQSAAMNDRWIVLGEPGNDDLNTDVGAVHIYEAATGKWLRKLSNPEPESDAEFGYSVAVSGDLALIGAPYANTAGIAFLFDLKTGALIRTIRAGGSSQKRFGYSVALEGRRAAVGAPGDLHPLPPFFITSVKTGSVKVYADLVASDASSLTLYPSDSAVNDLWGFSVCMDGGLLLGGAPFHNAEKGAAYLFDATTGEELHKLEDSTAERAGWSVALAGGYAYAGAPYSKDALTYPTGMILKHQVAGMNPASGDSEVRLYPSALNSSDYMGYSLAAWGSSMIAGAPNDNDPMFSTQDTGRADLFSFSSVESMTKPYRSIQAVDRQANDELGTAVCMWGNRVLMTAPYDDDLGDNAGAAYLITACPHFMDLRPLAVTNSQAPGLLDARHSLLGEAYACPDSLGAMFTSSLIGSGLAGGKGSAVFSSNDNSNNDYTPALSLVTGMDLGGMGLPGIKATSYYGFNPNNEQLYHAKLAGTGVNTTNDVLLLKDNGFTVSPLYREGTAVSSLGGAVVASWTQMIQPLTGAPFLLSQLKIGTAGVTAANDTALLQITGAGIAV
ncbi:MAG: hypothetical protein NTV80_24245, partial [Verrucomicrobia bacterium]|nr:hypothetical protein [Verrucomicrobiota bacterium]